VNGQAQAAIDGFACNSIDDRVGRPSHPARGAILNPGQLRWSFCGAQCPRSRADPPNAQFARTALIRAHAIGATIGFAKTAPRSRLPTIPCPSARPPPNKRPATTRRSMNLIARLDEEDDCDG
jgi:hypothetical protein